MKINGQLNARKSFDGTWFVECLNGNSCKTVATKLSEADAKKMVMQ